MAYGVNKVLLLGNLGKDDPEIAYTASQIPVAKFSMATSEEWKDKNSGDKVQQVQWHRVVAYGRLAELVDQLNIKAGSKVFIEGKVTYRDWEDKETGQKRYMTEINAREIVKLDPKGTTEYQKSDETKRDETPQSVPEDDIPF